MAKFLTSEEAAQRLGISEEELLAKRENGDINGYRDAGAWKFKPEDVDKLAGGGEGKSEGEDFDLPVDMGDDEDNSDDVVLMSEFELGESNPTTSSTVIGKGKSADAPGDSDIELADEEGQESKPKPTSDINLASEEGDADKGGSQKPDSDVKLVANGTKPDSDVKLVAEDSSLKLGETADDEGDTQLISREEMQDKMSGGGSSGVELGDEKKKKPESGGSDLVLGSDAMELSLDDELGSESGITLGEDTSDEEDTALLSEDEANVLGPSDSDLTSGASDSGISLSSPSDSGLSLESPLALGGSDEMLLGDEEADSDSVTELASDDDFVLTPMADEEMDESEDSGSQVIALDSDADEMDDSSATMLSGGGTPVAAMLEEEEAPAGGSGVGFEAAPETGGTPMVSAGPAPAAQAREAPYTIWNVVGLALCLLVLTLTGIMTYDLLRNMWSWDQTYTLNSSLMDSILGLFEG